MIKHIFKFIGKHIMPSRGNHISDSWDLNTNWKKCQEVYGEDFNFQLVKIDRKKHRVYLPGSDLFRTQMQDYLHNRNDGHFNVFKTIWLLNDYITVGWTYPVQAVWNWRLRWWEIHPGYQRGAIYKLFGVQEWLAWYQPMNSKEIEYIHKFHEPQELLDTMDFKNFSHIDAELIGYFNRPMIKLCIHIADLDKSADDFHDIFYKNIANGLNITGSKAVVEKIRKEVAGWPEHKLKDLIVFKDSFSGPTIHYDVYDKDLFYVGLYFAGTTLTEFNQFGIHYINQF